MAQHDAGANPAWTELVLIQLASGSPGRKAGPLESKTGATACLGV